MNSWAINNNAILSCKFKTIFFSFNLYIILTCSVLAANSNSQLSDLKLVGTITGKHVLAIIRVKDKSDGIYKLDQKILGYAITAITQKSVTLTKQNKTYSLNIIAIKNRLFYGINSNSKNNEIPKIIQYRINRNTFESLADDTQSWLNDVQMTMEIEKGNFTGYKIVRIQKNSPADLLGLTEGDVIRGINGILIKNNADSFIKKIGTLAKTSTFTLNMKHKQKKFDLRFIIEDQ